MKRTVKTLAIVLVSLTLAFATPMQVEAGNKTRSTYGRVTGYMTITTADGNVWKLSSDHPEKNRYMKYSRKQNRYVSRFKKGNHVRVKFNTMGTKNKTDDRIVSVKVCK
jgi:hypothetical protein